MSNTNMHGNWWDNEVAKHILAKKYYHEGEDIDAFLTRASSVIEDEGLRGKFKQALIDGDFFPGGRSLFAAGLKGKIKASTSNCYILPSPKDNIENIFDISAKMGRIFSYGGGCGLSLKNLRPAMSKTNNSALTSSGPIAFMQIYNSVAQNIGSNGRRK